MRENKERVRVQGMKEAEISPNHKRFCQEYTRDLNGAAAAVRAGYSKRSAKEQASEMLTKPNIKREIKALQDKIGQRTEISADRVVQELAKVGFNNIQDFIEGGNKISDLTEVDREKVASVESIKVTTKTFGKGDDKYTETTTALKLHDKIAALEKIGRHLGIFEKDNEQSKPSIKLKVGYGKKEEE